MYFPVHFVYFLLHAGPSWKVYAFLQNVCASLLSQTDRLFALSRLKQSGAYLTTTEAVLLQLVQDAKHPNFKEVIATVALC